MALLGDTSPAGATAADGAEERGNLDRAHAAYVEARYRHAAGQLRQTHTLTVLRRARARAMAAYTHSNAKVSPGR